MLRLAAPGQGLNLKNPAIAANEAVGAFVNPAKMTLCAHPLPGASPVLILPACQHSVEGVGITVANPMRNFCFRQFAISQQALDQFSGVHH